MKLSHHPGTCHVLYLLSHSAPSEVCDSPISSYSSEHLWPSSVASTCYFGNKCLVALGLISIYLRFSIDNLLIDNWVKSRIVQRLGVLRPEKAKERTVNLFNIFMNLWIMNKTNIWKGQLFCISSWYSLKEASIIYCIFGIELAANARIFHSFSLLV